MREMAGLAIAAIMLASGLVSQYQDPPTQLQMPDFAQDSGLAAIETTIYPNSDCCNLWVRKNGSDPGFPYPYANQPATLGMNYFGTDNLLVTWDYSIADLNDSSKFPSGVHIWAQMAAVPDASVFASNLADAARDNPRITGAFIDDFPVGRESRENMSEIYACLHHEDGNLTQGILSLAVIVYQYNYDVQTPNAWSNISAYIDVVSFWLYPKSYTLLYEELIGYEDSLREMKTLLPDAEYWCGIYLHYYNVGAYSQDFTLEQLRVASRLIREGAASKLSILENFWILNNPETATTVRDYIDGELANQYSTRIEGGQVITTAKGSPADPAIIEVTTTSPGNLTFFSVHLQLVSCSATGAGFAVQNMRTGEFLVTKSNGTGREFTCEPGQEYRVHTQPMTPLYYNDTTYLTSNTSWSNNLVYLNCTVWLNATLNIYDSVVRWGNGGNDSIISSTRPDYGLECNASARLYIVNSTFEPLHRNYAYYIDGGWPVVGSKQFVFTNSTFAGFAGFITPSNRLYCNDSVFFGAQPNGDTCFGAVKIICPSVFNDVSFRGNRIWNYHEPGLVGLYLQPGMLFSTGNLKVADNDILGGQFGLWADLIFGGNLSVERGTLASTAGVSDSSDYSQYVLENGGSGRAMTIECGSGEHGYGLRIDAGNQTMFSVETDSQTNLGDGISWRAAMDNCSHNASYTVLGLNSSGLYQVYHAGQLQRTVMNSTTCAINAPGNGTFLVRRWATGNNGVSPLVTQSTEWSMGGFRCEAGEIVKWSWNASAPVSFSLLYVNETTTTHLYGFSEVDGYIVNQDGFYGLDWCNNEAAMGALVSYEVLVVTPSLTVASPANGTFLDSRTASISGSFDGYADGVLVGTDGINFGRALTNGSSWRMDGLPLDEGTNTVYVRSYYLLDATGLKNLTVNRTTRVEVDTTAPELEIISPLQDSYLKLQANVSWRCSDRNGVARTEIKVDDSIWADISGDSVDIHLGDGQHTVQVRATDPMGNQATRVVTFIIDSTRPTLTILRPDAGSSIRGNYLTVEWRAADNLEVQDVRVWIDGLGGGTVGGSVIEHLRLANGNHTITIRVTDRAGNWIESTRTFTMNSRALSFGGPYYGLPTATVILVAIAAATMKVREARHSKKASPRRTPARRTIRDDLGEKAPYMANSKEKTEGEDGSAIEVGNRR